MADTAYTFMWQNPPLELSLDGSTGASDDHEVEEGGDGVWSVVGGKVDFLYIFFGHVFTLHVDLYLQ